MEKRQIIETIHEHLKTNSWSDPTIEGFKVVEVEEKGGEDEGSYFHKVFEVFNEDRSLTMFVLVTGEYNSYEGTDFSWGTASEVVPYEKTVRDWKTV